MWFFLATQWFSPPNHAQLLRANNGVQAVSKALT
jgi:hypothetical protein